FAKAHNNLGRALAIQGKLKEAIEYFENAININPNYVDANNNLERARSLSK
ncbi:MAG: tetratricopeptide repeat protein, partial [Nitrospina sp.]|nr:tetratricopeptide repeat protein [Nitrospina sp.]